MAASSSSRPRVRRGKADRSIVERAKLRAEREADRARYRGKARYYPGSSVLARRHLELWSA